MFRVSDSLVTEGKQQMYLFLEGELSLLRASDGLVVVTVYEPHLFGIAEMIQPTQGHLLRAERESTILRLDADKAAELFRAEGVWEDVAALLSYHTAYLIFRDARYSSSVPIPLFVTTFRK